MLLCKSDRFRFGILSTPQVKVIIPVTPQQNKTTFHTCQHHFVQHSSREVCHWERQTAGFQETVMALLVALKELSTSVSALVHPLWSSENTYSCLNREIGKQNNNWSFITKFVSWYSFAISQFVLYLDEWLQFPSHLH